MPTPPTCCAMPPNARSTTSTAWPNCLGRPIAAVRLRRRSGPLPEAGEDPRGRRGAGRRRRPGPRRVGRAALLRVRHRRRAAGRARRRLADQRLGPERGLYALSPGRRRSSRRSAAAWLLDLLGLPADVSVGFMTGATMANLPALAAARHARARAGRLGRRGATGCIGAPGDRGRRRRRGPRHGVRLAPDARARAATRVPRRRPTSRAGCAPTRSRDARRDRRPDDRLRPGRQREHRRRSTRWRRSSTPSRAAERLAPRRRRVRALGGARRRRSRTCSRGSSAPTRGRPTPTSGSTSRTTPASSSSATRPRIDAAMTLGAAYYVEAAERRARPVQLGPRVVAPGARLRGLRGAALARARRGSPTDRRAAARSPAGWPSAWAPRPGVDDPQRRRAQPGARPLHADATATSRRLHARVIAAVQADGTCWLGGTTWHGMAAMRISVSNWSTTEADIDRSAEAILRCFRAAG